LVAWYCVKKEANLRQNFTNYKDTLLSSFSVFKYTILNIFLYILLNVLNAFLDFKSLHIPNSSPFIWAEMCPRGDPPNLFKALNECCENLEGEIMG